MPRVDIAIRSSKSSTRDRWVQWSDIPGTHKKQRGSSWDIEPRLYLIVETEREIFYELVDGENRFKRGKELRCGDTQKCEGQKKKHAHAAWKVYTASIRTLECR